MHERFPGVFDVIQTGESNWDGMTATPDFTYGVLSASKHAIPPEVRRAAGVRHLLESALARRPQGAVLLGTSKSGNLDVVTEIDWQRKKMSIRLLSEGAIESPTVCIIGAGMAGLVAARRIARAGLSVVVLESGGPGDNNDVSALNAIDDVHRNYAGRRKWPISRFWGHEPQVGRAFPADH